MSNSNYSRLTTYKARSHCVQRHLHAHQETVNAMVLGTRRKWPRPKRDRDVCLLRPRRDRYVDNFSRDETETRRCYVSRPYRDRDVDTETTTLPQRKTAVTEKLEEKSEERDAGCPPPTFMTQPFPSPFHIFHILFPPIRYLPSLFPPSSFPFLPTHHFQDYFLPSSPFLSSRPCREAAPLNTARGSGERCKLPQRGAGQSPCRKRIFRIF